MCLGMPSQITEVWEEGGTRPTRSRLLLNYGATGTIDAEELIGETDPDTAERLQLALNDMSPAAIRCLTDVLRDIAGRLAV